jgi:hypothetical protein
MEVVNIVYREISEETPWKGNQVGITRRKGMEYDVHRPESRNARQAAVT